MILSKKAKAENDNEAMRYFTQKHNSKVLAQPKTIGVLILEDKDFYNYTELGMETAKITMMNKAHCKYTISTKSKSTMIDATALIVYGEYDGINFIGRPKTFWYTK